MTRQRSRTRISDPKQKAYPYKKRFYRDAHVAAHYDAERFRGPLKEHRNRRKWRAIIAALESLGSGVSTLLDLPCGTGRFTPALAARGLDVVGSDISHEMMSQAQKTSRSARRVRGFIQADAERLPLRDGCVDCVVSIRFMFHVDPPTRVAILREMGRVGRYQIVDYRHRYSYRFAKWKLLRTLRLTQRPLERVSRESLDLEFRDAGLRIRRIIPVTRVFSDKWIVVGERK